MRTRIAFAAVLAVGLVACGVEKPVEMAKTGDVAGQCDASKYPCGPFGYTIDSVIENLELVGRTDSDQSGVVDSGDELKKIGLSRYFQDKNIKAVVLVVAAEWCGPCRAEQPSLVATWKSYQSKGGHVAFVQAIVQNNARKPADMTVVDRWSTTFKIPFDMVADPTNALGPYYNAAAFPMQMLIRTKDMSIKFQDNGNRIKDIIKIIDNEILPND
jgi:thiol-disulfide isomerase/thioredoxin